MERALQFLHSHKDVALATSEGNIPRLRIFRVMKQEGNVLYFATSEQKAVWRELRKNPNVELIAYEGNISVRCSGMVNFNVEDATKRWIYEHNDVLQRLYTRYDQMAYFCLPIAEMDYYDLQPTPPEFLHFDLMAGEVSEGLMPTGSYNSIT
ncbi:MAG: pyridoxamine 5'-phosphate oxidase family protein [Prevotella sp.]|nr:pyridoxamine 5'-phosphate oxidase family protein [Prevotella sp.]